MRATLAAVLWAGCARATVPEAPKPTACGIATSVTKWYNRDRPSVTGDWELAHLMSPTPCGDLSRVLGAECQRISDGLDWASVPAEETGEITHACTKEGFVCKNKDKSPCANYRVRFQCGEPCATEAPATPEPTPEATPVPTATTVAPPPTRAVDPAHRAVLQAVYDALYDSAQGWPLERWMEGDACLDRWQGVTCDGAGKLRRLELTNVPTRNVAMPDLRAADTLLHLLVRGTSVAGFEGLPWRLREIDFTNTAFGGAPLPALDTLTRLWIFRAANAGVGGSVPALPEEVRVFDVSGNQLVGPLPQTMPYNMRVLNVRHNALVGPLPPCASCRKLIANNNQFAGTLPAYPALEELYVHFNNLEGPFTADDFPVVRRVDLTRNGFTGPLPVLPPTKIVFFKAGQNSFSGPYPLPEAGDRKLFRVAVPDNLLTGPEPTNADKRTIANDVKTMRNCWDCPAGQQYIDLTAACRGQQCLNVEGATGVVEGPAGALFHDCQVPASGSFALQCAAGFELSSTVVGQCRPTGIWFDGQLCVPSNAQP